MTLSVRPLETVMRSPLVTIEAGQTAASALAIAIANNIHHLPVLRKGQLVGLVCTCDLHEAAPEAKVAEFMTQPAVALDGANPPERAIEMMRQRRVGSCIVTSAGHPTGIVTRQDLLETWSGSEALVDDFTCECCGVSRHLQTNRRGQVLCAQCRERAGQAEWLDPGDEG